MSIFLKRISLMLLLMVLVSGCAKKLPPQVNEGKAFSKQPYVVQGNLRYQVVDYRYGSTMGDKPGLVGERYISAQIEVENLGLTDEKIASNDFSFKTNSKILQLTTYYPKEVLETPLKKAEKRNAWLIFKSQKRPKDKKILIIKKGNIIIE